MSKFTKSVTYKSIIASFILFLMNTAAFAQHGAEELPHEAHKETALPKTGLVFEGWMVWGILLVIVIAVIALIAAQTAKPSAHSHNHH